MSVEPSSENPLSALFGNLSWILPLVGVEQLVGWYAGFEYHSWKIGSILVALGPAFFVFAGGPWLRSKLTNLPRFKIVRVQKTSADNVEESFEVKDPPQYRELISDREFMNETVELDGRLFQNCGFKNVTFVYNGTEPTGFFHQRFSGTMKIITRNKAAEMYARFVREFTKMDGFVGFQRISQGADGKWVTKGPSDDDVEGIRYLMSELAICQTKLALYSKHTWNIELADEDVLETHERIRDFRRVLASLSEQFPQHLAIKHSTAFTELPPRKDGVDERHYLLEVVEDLRSKVENAFIAVNLKERKMATEQSKQH